jgi:hypothetical protein
MVQQPLVNSPRGQGQANLLEVRESLRLNCLMAMEFAVNRPCGLITPTK